MSTAAQVVARFARDELTLATAESLTAGLVAATLADVPGASAVLQGGVVAYQNRVKAEVLGVEAALLAERGAVDPGVAEAMARGARRVLGADVGVATTGVAGPEPHQGKPVGTVFIALAWTDEAGVEQAEAWGLRLPGDRAAIRRRTVVACLERLATAGERRGGS
ncbi:nicotinamide-nucleotide amidohydrolase family protein [Micrococcus sp. EYE_162]|uniref:CinA family protein n=1 Tax=Micrococcus TaxID=1269 RepID=UPI0020058BE8|nr:MULTISPECIES: nicotinamide-nucleotide amidohydrolase family protein [unclassified Micrococcus]MCK6094536.1 nicotinamide-nucleotide amidohydrolase family protein [Micrococcus sp. EYE_212]MCK6170717.1 nicotinamide-nucleotide amidohydrolase family protein [Micrococcus sp. EYE_162]